MNVFLDFRGQLEISSVFPLPLKFGDYDVCTYCLFVCLFIWCLGRVYFMLCNCDDVEIDLVTHTVFYCFGVKLKNGLNFAKTDWNSQKIVNGRRLGELECVVDLSFFSVTRIWHMIGFMKNA